ncbi:MAG TPA: tail fiber domain-containing protein, partial [Thermoanaerobaculia bacterium]
PLATDSFPIGLWVALAGTAAGNGFGALIQSSASNASVNNTGLRTQADSIGNINQSIEATASGATFRNTALAAKASGNASRNIGVDAEADGGQSLTYGIYASAQNGVLNRAGFFQGDIEVTGVIHNPSDQRLKQDIQDLDGAVQTLSALRPRSFAYRRDENPGLSLPEGRHLGLIAQELEKILSSLVTESAYPTAEGQEGATAQTYKSVNYMELIPLLVRGFQEQQALIAGQEARIRQLEAEKAASSSAGNR